MTATSQLTGPSVAALPQDPAAEREVVRQTSFQREAATKVVDTSTSPSCGRPIDRRRHSVAMHVAATSLHSYCDP